MIDDANFHDEETLRYVWASMAFGAGLSSFKRLFELFGSVDEIYKSVEYEGLSLNERMKKALYNKRLDEAYNVYKLCKVGGYSIIKYEDVLYPKRLYKISSPPAVIYCRGKLVPLEDKKCIAFVGTRKMTDTGREKAYEIAYECAKRGAVIVSGIAEGIDGICHKAALDAGGYTIGVLGTSIDKTYPKCNAELFAEMAKSNAIISEYYPGKQTSASSFPIRNRLISGLSDDIVVVEAGEKSGALITAAEAKRQGKRVHAVARISEGTDMLIGEGALPIESADDILKKSDVPKHKQKNERIDERLRLGADELQKKIVDIVSERKIASLDELIALTGGRPQNVLAALTMLELFGAVKATSNGYKLV